MTNYNLYMNMLTAPFTAAMVALSGNNINTAKLNLEALYDLADRADVQFNGFEAQADHFISTIEGEMYRPGTLNHALANATGSAI